MQHLVVVNDIKFRLSEEDLELFAVLLRSSKKRSAAGGSVTREISSARKDKQRLYAEVSGPQVRWLVRGGNNGRTVLQETATSIKKAVRLVDLVANPLGI